MTRTLALVLLGLTVAGCGVLISDEQIAALSASNRSWCLSLTTIYGTVRMGGSGATDAVVLCNQEGLRLTQTER